MPPEPDAFAAALTGMCAEVGIAIAFVPAPQGCPADARRIGKPPRNAEAMASFAREIRVAPGIVPGRMRKIGGDRVVPA
jgi:hypothetical protein